MEYFASAVSFMLEMIFSGTEAASNLLKLTPFSFGLTQLMTSFSLVTVPVASVILCIYFVIEVAEKLTLDQFNSEQFLRMLIKFAIGEWLISNASYIVMQFMNLGVALVNTVGSYSETGVSVTQPNVQSVLGYLGIIVVLFLPFVVSFMVRAAIFMSIFKRIGEMTVRAMFAPIGVADIVSGGAHSRGVSFLKKCLGVSLEGAMMMTALIVSNKIMTTVLNTDSSALAKMLLLVSVQLATLTMMSSCKSIAQDVVGG